MTEKIRISFVERKFNYFVSLESVFREVAAHLDPNRFASSFVQLNDPNDLLGTLKNLLLFRPEKDADVYHITGHCHYIALVLPPERTVLTIHDLGFLHTRRGIRRFILKKLLLDWPVKRLRYITVVSEATRDEVLENLPDAKSRIRVIDNPLNPKLHSDGKGSFNSDCPNILQVGTSPNKNLHNLIRAIEGIRCKLTLIGDLTQATRDLLSEMKIDYESRSNLGPEELRREYERADIVVFCSLYEGFGLPIIEAQAMSTPLITSDMRPLNDVAGDGALFADPNDHKSIRRSIERVINDPGLREELRTKGLNNIERFNGDRVAAQYAELYEEIVAAGRSEVDKDQH